MSIGRVVTFICLVFNVAHIYADVVGSNSAVSISNYYTFPQNPLLVANQIEGFVWMQSGFGLANSSTQCTYSAIFPVGGTIALNGGNLILAADLQFLHNASLTSLGTITGNGYRWYLDASLPSSNATIQSTNIVLSTNLVLTSTFTFQGACSISGAGYTLDITNGFFIISSNSSLQLSHLRLDGVNNQNIQCVDNTGQLTLDDTHLMQSNNFTWQYGSIFFQDKVSLLGTYSFTLETAMTCTIDSDTSVLFQYGSLLMGKNPYTLVNPLNFVDNTSRFHFDNCSVLITGSGINLTKGSLYFAGLVTLDTVTTATNTGMILGDGINSANDITVWLEPSATVGHSSGYWIYNNVANNKLISLAPSSQLTRASTSQIYVPKSLVLQNITVALASQLLYPIVVQTGQLLSYSNATIELPNIAFELTGNQYTSSIYELAGNGSLFVTEGTFPLGLLVSGAGNTLYGNGGLSGEILFMTPTSALLCGLNGFINSTIALNGATLTLNYNLLLDTLGSIVGPGVVNLQSNNLNVTTPFGSSPIYWEGAGGSITLNSVLSLSQTWTFSGNCTLEGNVGKIIMQSGGSIVVAPGSQLTLKNLRIYGLGGNNISCVDNTGSIIFLQTDNVLTKDYSFSQGSMQFSFDNYVSGAYTFSYETICTSTINTDSSFVIEDGATLYMGVNGGHQPLYFQDSTAQLEFDNAQLIVNNNGMQLTRGTVVVNNNLTVSASSASPSQGLTFGDGTSANDLTILLQPATAATFPTGYMTYNVTNPNGIVSQSNTASIVRYNDSIFNLVQNLNLENVTVNVSYLASLIVTPGMALNYIDSYIISGKDEFYISGMWYNAYTFLLTSGGSVNITLGSLPVYLLVEGTGNRIDGLGNVAGGIILNDSSTQLTIKANGTIFTSPLLNGGSISLEADVQLANDVILSGTGNIDLESNNLYGGKTPTSWEGDIYWTSDGGSIGIAGYTDLLGTWTFSGVTTINGNGQTLDITEGNIIIASGSGLVLNNVCLQGAAQQNIMCADDTGSITFENCCVYLADDFIFENGSLLFNQDNMVSGVYTFSYDSDQTSTISSNALWSIQDGATLAIGRKNCIEPLYFEDSTATLQFDNSTVSISPSGMRLTRGQVIVNHNIVVDVNSTNTSNGLIFGDGTLENDFLMTMNPATSALFPQGHVTYDVTNPNNIASKSPTARLIRDADSVFYLKQNLIMSNITVDVSELAQLLVDPGISLTYSDGILVNGQDQFAVTGSWYNYYTFMLGGDGVVNILNGTVPLYLLIQGTGNLISGIGNLGGGIDLVDQNTQLICDFNGQLQNFLVLSGGLLTLQSDMNCANDIAIQGPGIVNLQSFALNLGSNDLTWNDDMNWQGTNGFINLNSNVSLLGTWTLTGQCTIKGHNQILDLTNGALICDVGSSLTLENLTIKNICDDNIQCLDDDGSITLYNINWIQDCSVTFTQGAINLQGDVLMTGQGTMFSYLSSQPFTVMSKANLTFDTNFTFMFSPPISDTSNQLFVFEDQTSYLIFNGCSFITTTSGAQLTQGTLFVQRSSQWSSDPQLSIFTKRGISLGDGTNDMNVIINPGVTLELTTGILEYRNNNSASLVMLANTSVIQIDTGAALQLFQTINIGSGFLTFQPYARLYTTNGTSTIGSLDIQGVLYRLLFSF